MHDSKQKPQGKKLCHISRYMYPHLGGIESYISNLSKFLIEQGFEVEGICSGPETKTFIQDGIHTKQCKTWFTLFNEPFFPRVILEVFSIKAKIVMIHYPSAFLFVPLVLSRVFGKKIVLVYHGDITHFDSKRNFVVSTFESLIAPIMFFLSNDIIVTSEWMKKTNKKLSPFQNKIKIIPPGVDLDIFKPLSKSKNKVFTIGFLGRFVEYKGVKDLIKAVEELKKEGFDLELVFFGEGILKKFIESKGFTAKRIKQQKIPEELSKFDCLAIPSHYEPFGITALEAMACGVPVIASSCGGLNELIIWEDQKFPPHKVNFLKERIKSLFSNVDLRKKIIACQNKRVKEFEWKEISRKILLIIEK